MLGGSSGFLGGTAGMPGRSTGFLGGGTGMLGGGTGTGEDVGDLVQPLFVVPGLILVGIHHRRVFLMRQRRPLPVQDLALLRAVQNKSG
jgi:hypothetical protein